MAITHHFKGGTDKFGFGYFAYIEDGQLVLGESWPREGGVLYRGSFRDASSYINALREGANDLYIELENYYACNKKYLEPAAPMDTDCLSAAEARALTELARKPLDPWCKLFDLVKEAANQGRSMVIFDEEIDGAYFKEPRKEVAAKLVRLGYKATYSKVRNADTYYGEAYHNKYIVEW